MNKNLLIGIVVVLVVVGGAYYYINNSNKQAPTTNKTVPDENIITLSEQNASGESGTATLTEENGKVKVVLNLTGAPDSVTQPAHIHVGACPNVGAVKYALTSPVNGLSETILDVTLDQLKAEQPLGLNVHKSTNEASVYVSCGDLAL